MTTDTFPKLLSTQFKLSGGETITCTGVCKGVGMIHPNMATMLAVVATDAAVSAPLLTKAVKYAADRSFNCVTVDGDTSTNDSVVVLANGMAPGLKGTIDREDSKDFEIFQNELKLFSSEMAKLLIKDAEGATKFVTITVGGARSYSDAKTAAASIAKSALVKTALFGGDANWGRIVCALGYSGIEFDPQAVNLWIANGTELGPRPSANPAGVHLVKGGGRYRVVEEQTSKIVAAKEIFIELDLGTGGSESATYWTCDFSYDYVKINADYRT
eukprot:Colp12_sorted_trinity150504_noHs@18681